MRRALCVAAALTEVLCGALTGRTPNPSIPRASRYTLLMLRMSLLAALLLLLPTVGFAADLKVTDSSGAQVVVRNASIDYSGALGSAVRESNGIRVQQGEGTVTVKWKDITSLSVVRGNDSSKPARLEVDVLLRNGRHVTAVLQRPAESKLRGKTELGDYSLDLDKVRSIEPLR
jgi:hypothetical protein